MSSTKRLGLDIKPAFFNPLEDTKDWVDSLLDPAWNPLDLNSLTQYDTNKMHVFESASPSSLVYSPLVPYKDSFYPKDDLFLNTTQDRNHGKLSWDSSHFWEKKPEYSSYMSWTSSLSTVPSEIKPMTSSTSEPIRPTFPAVGNHEPSPWLTMPRRQKPRYDGDHYTPKWVRYTGHLKQGYCDSCSPGKWLQLKNSAYWYHKQFFHGISSVSGKPFMKPITQRIGKGDTIEGLCHQCKRFVPAGNAKKKNNFMLWYRHAHKCHLYDKPRPASTKPSSPV
ncbi:hypothetical protein BY458DRAFT_511403 [Sporodiniella umbellata]|nr:hypothetical protein BY458DRAFT_511403 [Sporodiniella umbellata]